MVPDQGGTRKLVAITASIEYVADNLAAVHGAMHARLGGARGGAGSQSQGSLVSFGRRVSAMNFVTFAMAMCDIMHGHILPLAFVAQASDVGALEVWRRSSAASGGLGLAVDHLRQAQVRGSFVAKGAGPSSGAGVGVSATPVFLRSLPRFFLPAGFRL